MNRLLLTVMFVLTTFVVTNAQDVKMPQIPGGMRPGTITLPDGAVVKGYVYNRSYQDNQNSCLFYTDANDAQSRKVFKPSELLGYTIENMQYKTVNYSGNIGIGKADKHFVYVAQPGAITTFIYWGPSEQVFWQKGDEEPFSNATMLFGFKKTMAKLVGDNAELAAKVSGGEKGYGMLNLANIVNEYNTWAAAQKQ